MSVHRTPVSTVNRKIQRVPILPSRVLLTLVSNLRVKSSVLGGRKVLRYIINLVFIRPTLFVCSPNLDGRIVVLYIG